MQKNLAEWKTRFIFAIRFGFIRFERKEEIFERLYTNNQNKVKEKDSNRQYIL